MFKNLLSILLIFTMTFMIGCGGGSDSTTPAGTTTNTTTTLGGTGTISGIASMLSSMLSAPGKQSAPIKYAGSITVGGTEQTQALATEAKAFLMQLVNGAEVYVKIKAGGGLETTTNPAEAVTVTTDANGTYTFSNVPDGEFIIKIIKNGKAVQAVAKAEAGKTTSAPVDVKTTIMANYIKKIVKENNIDLKGVDINTVTTIVVAILSSMDNTAFSAMVGNMVASSDEDAVNGDANWKDKEKDLMSKTDAAVGNNSRAKILKDKFKDKMVMESLSEDTEKITLKVQRFLLDHGFDFEGNFNPDFGGDDIKVVFSKKHVAAMIKCFKAKALFSLADIAKALAVAGVKKQINATNHAPKRINRAAYSLGAIKKLETAATAMNEAVMPKGKEPVNNTEVIVEDAYDATGKWYMKVSNNTTVYETFEYTGTKPELMWLNGMPKVANPNADNAVWPFDPWAGVFINPETGMMAWPDGQDPYDPTNVGSFGGEMTDFRPLDYWNPPETHIYVKIVAKERTTAKADFEPFIREYYVEAYKKIFWKDLTAAQKTELADWLVGLNAETGKFDAAEIQPNKFGPGSEFGRVKLDIGQPNRVIVGLDPKGNFIWIDGDNDTFQIGQPLMYDQNEKKLFPMAEDPMQHMNIEMFEGLPIFPNKETIAEALRGKPINPTNIAESALDADGNIKIDTITGMPVNQIPWIMSESKDIDYIVPVAIKMESHTDDYGTYKKPVEEHPTAEWNKDPEGNFMMIFPIAREGIGYTSKVDGTAFIYPPGFDPAFMDEQMKYFDKKGDEFLGRVEEMMTGDFGDPINGAAFLDLYNLAMSKMERIMATNTNHEQLLASIEKEFKDDQNDTEWSAQKFYDDFMHVFPTNPETGKLKTITATDKEFDILQAIMLIDFIMEMGYEMDTKATIQTLAVSLNLDGLTADQKLTEIKKIFPDMQAFENKVMQPHISAMVKSFAILAGVTLEHDFTAADLPANFTEASAALAGVE